MKNNHRRKHTRFEPISVDANIKSNGIKEIEGRILDSSKGGLAITFPKLKEPPKVGDTVEVKMIKEDSKISIDLGKGIVKRVWRGDDKGIIYSGKGIALEFKESINEEDSVSRSLLMGVQQNERIAGQKELIKRDLEYLGDYRRDLISCQLKLYSLMITVGVILAGSYFALRYHTTVSNLSADQSLSFWRAMVAGLPGILAIGCALMVVHKSESIQRIDSLLLLLKQYFVINKYPREYKGWESEYRKFRHVFKSTTCDTCKDYGKHKCGTLNNDDEKKMTNRGLFKGPKINLYHRILFASFIFSFLLSIFAVGTEILNYWKDKLLYTIITAGIIVAIVLTSVHLIQKFKSLRYGENCVESNVRIWVDLMNKCRWQA